MGVGTYNSECRSIVQRYTAEWEKTVTRLGRWIDFKDGYRTMDPEFMESVWWVFKTMFDKDLVYRGYKVMPYSTACGTPLSNFEAGLNYKDVNDPAVVVSFPLISDPSVSLLAWTTTPWTLPSNLALCVNDKFTYIKILDKTRNNKVFILLEKRLCQLFPDVTKATCSEADKLKLYEVLERFTGDRLVGLAYAPLFPYFQNVYKGAFRVVADGYVTEEGGTGIVHQAPAFGEDDYRVCLANKILEKGEDLPCPVDENGRFSAGVPEFKGRGVKEADSDICVLLKAQGRLVLKEQYLHSYPFCWRSDTPLIYKAVPSWFVSVEKVKARLVANNAQTYWVPDFVKEKRFHNWLCDAKDWAISRNRFWGTPIPLWVSDDGEEVVAVGSVQELFELSGVRVADLHKEFVDEVTIPSRTGRGVLRRIEEVFDCWFESGSMPYAQLHYPFENRERFERGFPADFIAEGLDQTRGWFYTLMVISTCLFDKPAFKNLIVNGLVLAADGKKMSKRLSNYPDPQLVLTKFGADALRLYLINSPVVRAEVLRFTEEGVGEVVRGVLLPWYNAFRFFIQCVERYEGENSNAFVPDDAVSRSSHNDLDVWILASTFGLVQFVHREMGAYRLYTVVPRLVGFIEQLTNWYVRLNRDRLKGSLGEAEALLGLNVLFEVLWTVTVLMAPVTPFLSEYFYQHLRKLHANFGKSDVPADAAGRADSVHFLMLPAVDPARINPRAESRFATLQQAVTLARTARERRRIRNNLPLRTVTVVAASEDDVEALQYLKSYFMSEVNCWDVTLSTEVAALCSITVVPNFKVLGLRLGKQMKALAAAVAKLTQEQALLFLSQGSLEVCGCVLSGDDLSVRREFRGDKERFEASGSEDGRLLVAIDTHCDEDMLDELRARSVAAAVQRLRKSGGLVVGDRVEVFYEEQGGAEVARALAKHGPATARRIKGLPLPLGLRPVGGHVLAKELVNDIDISASPVQLLLVQPALSSDRHGLRLLVESTGLPSAAADTLEMYLQSVDLDRALAAEALEVSIDGVALRLVRGKHYFSTALELLQHLQTSGSQSELLAAYRHCLPL